MIAIGAQAVALAPGAERIELSPPRKTSRGFCTLNWRATAAPPRSPRRRKRNGYETEQCRESAAGRQTDNDARGLDRA